MKPYNENRIELSNLQMLNIMLKNSNQFLSSEQPCEPKSLDAGVKRIHSESLRLRSGGHLIRVLNERSVSDGGNLCPVVGDSQISLT